MISLIIPIYNISKFAPSLFANLQESDSSLIEILLVDDGSVDDTYIVMSELIKLGRADNIKLFKKLNGGVSSARNFGIKLLASESKFVCFFDSDDVIHFDTLLEFYASCEKDKICSDIVFFNHERKKHDKVTTVIHGLTDSFDIQSSFEKLYVKGLIQPCWNKVYRTEIIINKGIFFDEEISMGEDFRFNINYMKHCNNFASFNGVLYTYNVFNYGSLSNRFNENSFELFKYGIDEVAIFCDSKGIAYKHLNNRYLYALTDRISNLFKSKLPLNVITRHFIKDFDYVLGLDGIDYAFISNWKDKAVYYALKFKAPLSLLFFFLTLFSIKSFIRNVFFKKFF